MKKLAISLFVLGVVSVQGGVVRSHSSSSGGQLPIVGAPDHLAQQADLLVGAGTPWSQDASQHRDCIQGGRDNWFKQDWEEDCEDYDKDECDYSVHTGRAGEHASGDVVTAATRSIVGVVTIPAQTYVTECECIENNESHQEGEGMRAVHSEKDYTVTGSLTNEKYEVY
jgi:hypothetical protein